MRTFTIFSLLLVLSALALTAINAAPTTPKRNLLRYLILSSSRASDLQRQVDAKLAQGQYRCAGGVSYTVYVDALDINNHIYTQALELKD